MKSFSEVTKNELSGKINDDVCCNMAEVAGMILFGSIVKSDEIKFVTENKDVCGRYRDLTEALDIPSDTTFVSCRFYSVINDISAVERLLKQIGMVDTNNKLIRYKISSDLTEKECCRRSFVRGAFMGGGTVIDPAKNYNLEITTQYYGLCNMLSELLAEEGFNFKTLSRKSKYVIYTKKSDDIQDFLTYIGAFNAQMSLINVKIEKEIRNNVNRTVNGENANYDKTVSASVKQVRAIDKISAAVGLESLPPELYEIAKLRLENKSKSLNELGKLMEPPLGKSGVNHRMKKIIDIADNL